MEQPTLTSISNEDPEEVERLRGCIARSLQTPLEGWGVWTSAAEEGLLAGMGVQRTGQAYRGGPRLYKRSTLSRTQD